MISFKSFIQSIHDAVLKANDALMDKNTDLLDKYFKEKRIEVTDKEGIQKTKKILEPISVVMQYPTVDDEGNVKNIDIHVPLITIVPITTSQIEKAKLTADFDMEIVDGDLQIDFSGKKKSEGLFKKGRTSKGTLEITISPQDTSDGLKLLIDGYETLLKRQIP
ncbi:MAG: hypothetical protein ACI83B_000637 [Sediminicola sp.]|jgi:hypothetical protein